MLAPRLAGKVPDPKLRVEVAALSREQSQGWAWLPGGRATRWKWVGEAS